MATGNALTVVVNFKGSSNKEKEIKERALPRCRVAPEQDDQ